MTMAFLDAMFGRPTGPARQWLAGLSREPRIAWYPSAGEDFRDLLYLSEEYARCFPSGQAEPAPPDLFLHTDYFPWTESRFLDTAVVHQDTRTTIRVEAIDELPRCDLPLDARIVQFPVGSVATGRVLFLLLRVTSAQLAMDRVVPVLYAFCENAAFCAERLLPLGARCSHVVRVRYGGGCGGGQSSGHWILRNLDRLHCELLVWDQHDNEQDGDRRCLERFPNLKREGAQPYRFRRLRTLPEAMWSGHGDVAWDLVVPVSG
jgi:hypothetical protein